MSTPNPHAIWLDETRYLTDDGRAACGELFTCYVYDAAVGTHCCELTPSYWLEAIAFETTNEIPEDLEDELRRSMYESAHYRHCSNVAKLNPEPVVGDFENMEEVLEYLQGNPPSR